MRKIDFSKEAILQYYKGDFSEHLMNYFKIERHNGINVILFVDVKHQGAAFCSMPGRPAYVSLLSSLLSPGYVAKRSDEIEKNFIFSGVFAFMILTQQALAEVFDYETSHYFHECSGWPQISAGLGGTYCAFDIMLKEAELYPCKVEVENYVAMLPKVFEVMEQELLDFLTEKDRNNLCEQSYLKLISKVSGRENEVILHIDKKIKGLIEELNKM